MSSLQVHVVDDDDDVRKGLLILLESAGYPAHGYSGAADFLEHALASARTLAGCLIVDLRMPGLDGLGLQRRLVEAGSALPVIFLSGHGELPDDVEAMRAGAIDFLLKPVDGSRLLQHIGQVWQRESERVQRAALQAGLMQMMDRLTGREREVLTLALDGMQNRDISASLQLSERTVEAHRSRLLLKLDAPSLQAWLLRCEQAGLARQDLLARLSPDIPPPIKCRHLGAGSN